VKPLDKTIGFIKSANELMQEVLEMMNTTILMFLKKK
jgi:hypothetical protein